MNNGLSEKTWRVKLAGVSIAIALAVMLILVVYRWWMLGMMYHDDKMTWGYMVDFRCQLGRWPKSSEELVDRATANSRPRIQEKLERLGGIRFSNYGQDVSARAIRIRFISKSGLVDDWPVRFEDGMCDDSIQFNKEPALH